MHRFSPGRWLEAVFWLGFAVLAYAFTFSFDREIEIYRFGAAGWPRAVIVLLALAALARHPDLFACGVEAMGFADPRTLNRTLDPERRAFVEGELGPVRGNLENYRRLSLNGEGAAVRAPLLSFHGEEVPEAPFAAKSDFLAELRSRADYPLVELTFRGDAGRSILRWETDRGANYAFFQKVLEFLSVHLQVN